MCRGPAGPCAVEFVRAGTLTVADRPELYFFRVNAEEVTVGISGSALEEFQFTRRLAREEKVDVAGLHLSKQIAAGRDLDSRHLLIRGEELQQLAGELGLAAARQS